MIRITTAAVGAAVALALVPGCADGSGPTAKSARQTSHVNSGKDQAAPRPLVAGAVWLHPPEGYRLQVHPSSYGRFHSAADPSRALRQALRAARPTPLHLSATIRGSLENQLRCHAVFAALKPRWNLETWRPDVGYAETVAALCNP